MYETALDLNEMRVFAAVAARRSFVGAALALRMPKATVSRKVKALEGRLGVRLLQRTTRRVSLTEAGSVFHERCTRIEEEIAEAERAVGKLGARPRGTLRVTAPYTLAREVLLPLVPGFLRLYPEIRLWLTLRNEPEDLVGRGVDVALSPWPVADSDHAARLLGTARSGLYASPAYLRRRGAPRAPADLAGHDALLYSGGAGPVRFEWTLRQGERTQVAPLAPVLVSNDATPLEAAAVAGAGILLASPLSLSDRIRSGALVPVLAGWAGPDVEVRALFPTRIGVLPKVRVFVDFLVERVVPSLARPGARPADSRGEKSAAPRARGPAR